MPNVQPSYNSALTAAVAGQLADFEPHRVITRECQASGGIVFGAAVSRGTADYQCQPSGTGLTLFLGVALVDPTVRAENNNQYAQLDSVAIITKGVVWVQAAVAVTPGQQAYFDASGNITNVSTSNTLMTGCFFDTTTTGAGLAKLRMN